MNDEEKRSTVRELLLDGVVVRIVFKVRDAGVIVPTFYKDETHLAFDFGLNGADALTDLEMGDDAISATLRFGGEHVWCSVPWDAVIGLIPHGEVKPMYTTAWQPKLLKGGLN